MHFENMWADTVTGSDNGLPKKLLRKSRSTKKSDPAPPKTETNKKLAFHEKREYEALGIEIEQMEEQIKALEEAMANPEFFQSDPEHAAAESARYQGLQNDLELKFLRFMELDERAN